MYHSGYIIDLINSYLESPSLLYYQLIPHRYFPVPWLPTSPCLPHTMTPCSRMSPIICQDLNSSAACQRTQVARQAAAEGHQPELRSRTARGTVLTTSSVGGQQQIRQGHAHDSRKVVHISHTSKVTSATTALNRQCSRRGR